MRFVSFALRAVVAFAVAAARMAVSFASSMAKLLLLLVWRYL